MGNKGGVYLTNNTKYSIELMKENITTGYSSTIYRGVIPPKLNATIQIFSCESRIVDSLKPEWFSGTFLYAMHPPSDSQALTKTYHFEIVANITYEKASVLTLRPVLMNTDREDFPFIYSDAVYSENNACTFEIEEPRNLTPMQPENYHFGDDPSSYDAPVASSVIEADGTDDLSSNDDNDHM
jgi:hypothetical protein